MIKHLLFLFLYISSLGSIQGLSAACELWDLTILKSACSKENFSVKINFKYQDVSTCFTIKGNGKDYGTFEYTNLPIIIDGLLGDCSTDFEFKITDCQNEHCSVTENIGKVCCVTDCKISELRLEKTRCDSNELFYVILNFDHHNTSKCFRLKINDHPIGEFEYSSLPLKIGPLEGDCHTERVFTVSDCEKPECSARIEMDRVCCNECKISKIKIEKTDCDSLDMFSALISFNAENVSDSFFIKVNDKIYGKFKYGNSSYKVGPLLGDCITKYKIIIFDHKNTHCAEDTLWGPVCCNPNNQPCKLSELVVERLECDDLDQFYLKIDFDHSNTSECFQVYYNNGIFYGEFSYSSLPLKLGPFPGDCHTEYKLVIKDCKDSHCAVDKFIGKVCCTEPCKFYEFEFSKSDCNSDNQFFVTVNFLGKNASTCFKAFVNNDKYGEYKYTDLPLTLGPFKGDCHTEYGFVFKDCEDPHCALEKNIGKVCCGTSDCKISNLSLEKLACNDQKKFFVILNFDHANTSHCFKLKINDDLYGVFDYGSLPLKLGPFEGDCHTERNFEVFDCERPDACSARIEMDKVCCEPSTDCKLYELEINKTDCNSDKQFYVTVDFLSKNASECFKIFVNNDLLGEFKYASLPIRLGPFNGDCHTDYKFLIKDCLKSDCHIERSIGKVCCEPSSEPCKLSELKIERSDCYGDKQFFAFINFNYSGTSECFRIKGNGHDYGEFRYGQFPVKIGPLTADCHTEYEFVVIDCKKPECHIAVDFGKVCCDASNSKIYDVEMIRSDCEPDSTFHVKFNFHHREVSDSFNIFVNGRSNGTYGYNQLPVRVGPLLADCKTIYKIQLIDQKDTTIRIERFIERPCCHPNLDGCKIYDVVTHPLHCTGPNEYSLYLDFKHRGTTNRNFELYDRSGAIIGYFSFAQLPITINNFKASGRDFDFLKICENDNPRCCTPIEFRTIDCDSLINNPRKFSLTNLFIFTNNASNTVSIFSELEIPTGLEIEMFNLEGKQIPVDIVEIQNHQIFISTAGLSTNLYFLRLKGDENTKTYKFFHIR